MAEAAAVVRLEVSGAGACTALSRLRRAGSGQFLIGPRSEGAFAPSAHLGCAKEERQWRYTRSSNYVSLRQSPPHHSSGSPKRLRLG